MPVLKHARKKLRQDKKRAVANAVVKKRYKDLLKTAKKSSTAKNIGLAMKAIDKAAKNGIIHTNKAARLKSSLSKVAGGGKSQIKVSEAKPAKKAEAKVTKPKSSPKKSPAKPVK